MIIMDNVEQEAKLISTSKWGPGIGLEDILPKEQREDLAGNVWFVEESSSSIWCSPILPSWGLGDVHFFGEQKACYRRWVLDKEQDTGDRISFALLGDDADCVFMSLRLDLLHQQLRGCGLPTKNGSHHFVEKLKIVWFDRCKHGLDKWPFLF